MNDFEVLVMAMRKAQKEYFRTKDRAILLASKDLEKKVDDYLKKKEEDNLIENLFGSRNDE